MRSAESERDEAFRRIGEHKRFEGKFFTVLTGRFVGPDGFTFEREVVRHPGAVCAVCLEDDNVHVLMVRQYRAAVAERLLEVPAGKRDVEAEEPEATIAREIAEEVGKEPGSVVELLRFYNSPGYTDEETICYLCEQLTDCERRPARFEEEHMSIERVRLDSVEELIATGELIDGKSIIALLAARRALRRRSQPTVPS